MADKRTYYVLCADNCKFESMTKEQILTAIEQATSTGEIQDVDTGFVTKIKEQNSGAGLSFWVGTQAQYNALETKIENCFYIISDATDGEDISNAIKSLQEEIEALQITVAEAQKKITPINRGGTGANDATTALENLGVADYVTEEGFAPSTGGSWWYRKWFSGKKEAWYKNDTAVEIAAQSILTENIPLPDGVFDLAPDFIQPSFVTNTESAQFGLCEIYATLSGHDENKICVRLSNSHTSKFKPNYIVYVVQL